MDSDDRPPAQLLAHGASLIAEVGTSIADSRRHLRSHCGHRRPVPSCPVCDACTNAQAALDEMADWLDATLMLIERFDDTLQPLRRCAADHEADCPFCVDVACWLDEAAAAIDGWREL